MGNQLPKSTTSASDGTRTNFRLARGPDTPRLASRHARGAIPPDLRLARGFPSTRGALLLLPTGPLDLPRHRAGATVKTKIPTTPNAWHRLMLHHPRVLCEYCTLAVRVDLGQSQALWRLLPSFPMLCTRKGTGTPARYYILIIFVSTL
jgi:hypothetical protein